MADYLMRDDSPLSVEQWEQLDKLVIDSAKSILVARRFVPTYGPVGVGLQVFEHPLFSAKPDVSIDVSGTADDEPVGMPPKRYLDLPVVSKKFVLGWRDIETTKQLDLPLELGAAITAAKAVATAEDRLVMVGDESRDLPGLFTVEGRQAMERRENWEETTSAFYDVADAIGKLTEAGYVGPYALVTHPSDYARLHRVIEETAVLEIDQIRELVSKGIFQSPAVPKGQAAVVSFGSENFDLVVGQDLVAGFLETTEGNHLFRVFEIVAPRIKRPDAIVTIS